MSDNTVGTLIVEGGMLIVATLTILGTGIWKLSSVRDDLKDVIEEHKKEVNDDLTTLRSQFGETIAALREKVTQVELYIRDNYVRKDSFSVVTERILAELKVNVEKFENRFTTMETRIMNYLHESRESPPSSRP